MKPSCSFCTIVLVALSLSMFMGCNDSLVRAKDAYGTGATTGAFDQARLDALAKATQDVMSQKARYGDEGAAQAELMLAYGYVSAGRFDDASALVKSLELSVDMTKVSPSSRAFLAIVKADTDYEKALNLATQDVCGNGEAIGAHVQSAINAYEQARTSASFSSEPVLRQLLALRETDILISFGDLTALWDVEQANQSYSRAVQVATEAAVLNDALRKELVQRSIEANNLLKSHSVQGTPK